MLYSRHYYYRPRSSIPTPPPLSDNACQASETPHVSALRFCGQNLPAIESALGVNIVEEVVLPGGDDDAVGEAIPAGGGGGGGGERESLKEACAMVVEDAINAVLLGLRERVRACVFAIGVRVCIRFPCTAVYEPRP